MSTDCRKRLTGSSFVELGYPLPIRGLLTSFLFAWSCLISLFLPEPVVAAKWGWGTAASSKITYVDGQTHPKSLSFEWVVTESVKHSELFVQYAGPHRGPGKAIVEFHRTDGSLDKYRLSVETMRSWQGWRLANDDGTPLDIRLRVGDIVLVEFRFQKVEKIFPGSTTRVFIRSLADRNQSRLGQSIETSAFRAAGQRQQAKLESSAKLELFGQVVIPGPTSRKHPKRLVSAMRLAQPTGKTAVCIDYLSGSRTGKVRATVRVLRSDGSSSKTSVKLKKPNSFTTNKKGCTGKLRTAAGDWLEVTSKFKKFLKVGSVRLTITTESL